MAANASAYAVLGLEPGADWPAVERAYRTLIKAHHPDRPGGDADRAAEINRAFRELRRAREASDYDSRQWGEHVPEPAVPERSGHWLPALFAIAAGVVLLILLAEPSSSLVADFRTRSAPLAQEAVRTPATAAAADEMDQPLNGAAIQSGVDDAMRVASTRNEAAMAEATRKCHSELRAQPSLAELDRCAAFDDAIVQLENRDPWRDDGPFGQVAVTGREMSAANLLSEDYLAIDGRLDRIRVAVELALAPGDPGAGPPAN